MRENIQNKNYFRNVILVVIFFVLVIITNFVLKIKEYKKDFLMAVVASDGIEMVNVSIERGIINKVKIDKKVDIWYPDGSGWNSQDRIKNLFNKKEDIKRVFFYNFGFLPDKIIQLETTSDWENMKNLLSEMGLGKFLYFSAVRENMIFNNELISTKLENNSENFSEIMVRDFANDEILNDDKNIKISVINTTQDNGLANFIGTRLEWMGALVTMIGTEKKDLKDNCLLSKNENKKVDLLEKKIAELFECKVENNSSLPDDQMELYFGDKFSKMIKYPSYVRTF